MSSPKPQNKRARTMCKVCRVKPVNRAGALYCSAACSQAAQRVEAPVVKDSVTTKGNTQEITKTSSERVRTLDDLVRVCEIDLVEWEVTTWRCTKSDMGSVPRPTGHSSYGPTGGDGSWSLADATPIVTELFHVTATLKRKVVQMAVRDELVSLIEDAKRVIPARPPSKAVRVKGATGLMLEVAIPDLHVGKLAWAKETGWENYDSRIAEQIFEEALETLLARTSGHVFDRVLFPIGNDLLHSDTKAGTTTGGTLLDTDSRYHKSFAIVRKMMTRAIDRLRDVAPLVDVVAVPGNHDELSTFHLADSLECYFHQSPEVIVHNEPKMRKYIQHGKVMILLTHGHGGKLPDYPLLMATEQPVMFGATIHREAHTGHLHQVKVHELHGVKVRISPALCPPDAWHAGNAFVGNARSAEAFVWHTDEGLISTANFTVKPPSAFVTE